MSRRYFMNINLLNFKVPISEKKKLQRKHIQAFRKYGISFTILGFVKYVTV